MSKIASSALALVLVLASHAAGAASGAAIVWNQGFGTGPTGLDWTDQADGQNMADSVTLSRTTAITGYTFYSATDLGAETGGADFQLKVFSSQDVTYPGGFTQAQPNRLLLAENIGFTRIAQVCDACVPSPSDPSDPSSPLVPSWDAYALSFRFAPITLQAGTTYWIGLSGNGFDADTLSVWNVQDNSMAQFWGDEFEVIATGGNGAYPVGDQMFQLIGSPVPEPANLALLGAGLVLAGLGARRRRRD